MALNLKSANERLTGNAIAQPTKQDGNIKSIHVEIDYGDSAGVLDNGEERSAFRNFVLTTRATFEGLSNVPSSANPKNVLPDESNKSPLGLFYLFFTEKNCEVLAKATNTFVANNIVREGVVNELGVKENEKIPWVEITTKEIKIWLGLVLYMGMFFVREIEDLWNTRRTAPIHGTAAHMSQTRFKQIQRNIHVSDNEQELCDEIQEYFDKQAACKTLVKHLEPRRKPPKCFGKMELLAEQLPLLFWLLDTAADHAYRLHKEYGLGVSSKKGIYKHFCVELWESLLDEGTSTVKRKVIDGPPQGARKTRRIGK